MIRRVPWVEVFLAGLLIACLSFMVLALANPRLNPPGRDGGFFMYVGQQLALGKTLYQGIWDSKGPLIFWINALGVGKDGSRWGLFLLQLAFLGTWLSLAYYILRRFFGIYAAILGVVCGAFCFKLTLGNGNFTEEYSLLFTWLALAGFAILLAKPKAVFWPFALIGVSTLLSFLLRANNIGTHAAAALVGLLLVYQRGRFKAIGRPILGLLLGALLVIIPVTINLAFRGNLKAMWEASFVYNFAYSVSGGQNAASLGFLNASLLPGLTHLGAWSWFLILGWLAAIYQVWQTRKELQKAPWAALAAIAFPIEVLFSSISGRKYPHYFICWVPVAMLLTAILTDFFQKSLLREEVQAKLLKTKPTLPLLLSIAILLLVASGPIYTTARSSAAAVLRPNRDYDFTSNFTRRLRDISAPDDKILVFGGQAGENIMAKRASIDAALFYPAINNSPIGKQVQAAYFEALKQEMPEFIIDGHEYYSQQVPSLDPEIRAEQRIHVQLSENLPEVLAWIEAHYEPIEYLDHYTIYKLR